MHCELNRRRLGISSIERAQRLGRADMMLRTTHEEQINQAAVAVLGAAVILAAARMARRTPMPVDAARPRGGLSIARISPSGAIRRLHFPMPSMRTTEQATFTLSPTVAAMLRQVQPRLRVITTGEAASENRPGNLSLAAAEEQGLWTFTGTQLLPSFEYAPMRIEQAPVISSDALNDDRVEDGPWGDEDGIPGPVGEDQWDDDGHTAVDGPDDVVWDGIQWRPRRRRQ